MSKSTELFPLPATRGVAAIGQRDLPAFPSPPPYPSGSAPANNTVRRTTTAVYPQARVPQPPPGGHLTPRTPLTPRTIELVQQSWAKVMPISDAAATLFYGRLFELDPSLRALFKSDLGDQKRKLVQTLSVAVDGLNNPGKLIPVLQALGERHVGYMVAEHHYDRVGEALLWTLREGLGDGFTRDVEEAWTAVYGLVAGVMKEAATRGAAPGNAEAAKPTGSVPPQRQGIVVPVQSSRPDDLPDSESSLLGARTLVGVSRPDGEPGALPASDGQAAPAPLTANDAVLGNGASPNAEIDDGAAALRGAGARAPAGAAPRVGSFVVPLMGQDMTFHVHVKLEYPPLLPVPASKPRAVDATRSRTLDMGALLALFCIASSMGATLLFGLGTRTAAGLPASTLYGVPLLVMVLVFGSFCFGYIQRRGAAQRR